MTEQEEAKEVKRLSALVDSGRNAQDTAAAQLAYLTGDPSTREKVRRLLTSQVQRSEPAFHGLFIARNRSFALKLLEAVIGKYGSADDQRLLEARLNRWQAQWPDKVDEANEAHQGQFERELINALINGKSWKLTSERVNELRMSCLSQNCKLSLQAQ